MQGSLPFYTAFLHHGAVNEALFIKFFIKFSDTYKYHISLIQQKRRVMKQIILFSLVMLILISAVHAAIDTEELPPSVLGANVEEVDPLLQPLVNTLQPLIRKANVLVGGIFGLYIILILVRIHYERKTVKLLKDIRYDLDNLNKHYNLPHSRSRNGFFQRLLRSLGWKEHSEKKKSKKD